jgi:hypothetical protein
VRGVVGANDADLDGEPTPLAELVACQDYEQLVGSWFGLCDECQG